MLLTLFQVIDYMDFCFDPFSAESRNISSIYSINYKLELICAPIIIFLRLFLDVSFLWFAVAFIWTLEESREIHYIDLTDDEEAEKRRNYNIQ